MSLYPNKDEDVIFCLNQFKKIKNTLGYSDHSYGITTYVSAHVLEFHFTDSRKNKSFRDHLISLTKNEVQELCLKLKRINKMIGNSKKIPLKSEIRSGHTKSFRRAIYFKREIKKGTIISQNDLIYLRPNIGLDARKIKTILGKKARKNYKQYQKITI